MDKLKWFLYLGAVLSIVIPTIIVILSDHISFSSTFSHTLIFTSLVLVIMAKMLTVYQKSKEKKNFATDIGAIIGLSIVITLKVF